MQCQGQDTSPPDWEKQVLRAYGVWKEGSLRVLGQETDPVSRGVSGKGG